MKIYTKTGDDGTTGLLGGTRLPKSANRIEAYGNVDELNSWIGLLRDQPVNAPKRDLLKAVQDRLFTIGSTLARAPEKSTMKIPDLNQADIDLLEQEMDAMDAELPELRSFILPGGHQAVSYGHIARCVCRRTERQIIRLAQNSYVAPLVIQYVNRLSDYLFVLSRYMGKQLNAEEVTWQPRQ